jgi:hypothetical protein
MVSKIATQCNATSNVTTPESGITVVQTTEDPDGVYLPFLENIAYTEYGICGSGGRSTYADYVGSTTAMCESLQEWALGLKTEVRSTTSEPVAAAAKVARFLVTYILNLPGVDSLDNFTETEMTIFESQLGQKIVDIAASSSGAAANLTINDIDYTEVSNVLTADEAPPRNRRYLHPGALLRPVLGARQRRVSRGTLVAAATTVFSEVVTPDTVTAALAALEAAIAQGEFALSVTVGGIQVNCTVTNAPEVGWLVTEATETTSTSTVTSSLLAGADAPRPFSLLRWFSLGIALLIAVV